MINRFNLGFYSYIKHRSVHTHTQSSSNMVNKSSNRLNSQIKYRVSCTNFTIHLCLSQLKQDLTNCCVLSPMYCESGNLYYMSEELQIQSRKEVIACLFLIKRTIWDIIHVCSANGAGKVMRQNLILRFRGLFKSVITNYMSNNNRDTSLSKRH